MGLYRARKAEARRAQLCAPAERKLILQAIVRGGGDIHYQFDIHEHIRQGAPHIPTAKNRKGQQRDLIVY